MGHKLGSRLVVLAVLGSLTIPVSSIPLGAAAAAVDYQLTITESSSTMTYGELSPVFHAYLTEPSDDPPLNVMTAPLRISVDSQDYYGSLSGTNPTYALYVPALDPRPLPGQHSVIAKYLSPNHGVLTSSPVALTVLKSTPGLSCGVMNFSTTYTPNSPLKFSALFSNTNAPVDFQNGTFTVTFVGAQTFSFGNLKANSALEVTTPVPAAYGVYNTKCAFSGTNLFNPVETTMSIPTTIVSGNNPVGGIALYTEPAPVTGGALITWKVVVSGRPGLPAPTGYISLTIAGASTQIISLGAGGSVTFQARAPGIPPSATIQVSYNGDSVYAASQAYFPLTTRPIANSAPPRAATTTPPAATPPPTPSPSATESATPLPSSDATPSATATRLAPSLASATGPSKAGAPGAVVLVGAIFALMLLGIGSGLAWRLRRRQRI